MSEQDIKSFVGKKVTVKSVKLDKSVMGTLETVVAGVAIVQGDTCWGIGVQHITEINEALL